jgi:hypothetical protein
MIRQRHPIKRSPIRKTEKSRAKKSLTAECDKLAKQLIIAERGDKCERCGKSDPQSAHILSKGHYQRIRFLKENLLLLCVGCHIYGAHKDPTEFTLWIDEKWPGRIIDLRMMAATAPKVDLKLLAIVLRAEVRALDIEG